jgi:anti-sigma factor RsiW
MAHDREVAGIRCSGVLSQLSDYVDGELAPADRAQIDAHLAGCDWCERFGGRFASVIGELRGSLSKPAVIDPAVSARLRERLGLGET